MYAIGTLRARLSDAFGHENVFFDVDSIEFGLDFRTVIRDRLRTVDAVVMVIGPGFDPDRLAQEDDNVRLELVEALSQGTHVVPVLVDDARMPEPDELPGELRTFAYRNAAVLRPYPDFARDVDRLVESLKRTLKPHSVVDSAGSPVAQPTARTSAKGLPATKAVSTRAAAGQARRQAEADQPADDGWIDEEDHESDERADRVAEGEGIPQAYAEALLEQGFYKKVSDRIFYHDQLPDLRLVLLRQSVRLEKRQPPPYEGREWQLQQGFSLTKKKDIGWTVQDIIREAKSFSSFDAQQTSRREPFVNEVKPRAPRSTMTSVRTVKAGKTGRPSGQRTARETNRRRLTNEIERLGFFAMSEAKRVYYHTQFDYYGKNQWRIVVLPERMRVELRKKYVDEWRLSQSYNLEREVDRAIEAAREIDRHYTR